MDSKSVKKNLRSKINCRRVNETIKILILTHQSKSKTTHSCKIIIIIFYFKTSVVNIQTHYEKKMLEFCFYISYHNLSNFNWLSFTISGDILFFRSVNPTSVDCTFKPLSLTITKVLKICKVCISKYS